ncbi:MAG TPA: gamma-glutamylcyclotransferase [Albidovulum sp.]|uniref:gamma-glutamylcyclotransferase family protein n=1 Tax=Albidovulum sp. TaxID=1872424 RepID=UPI002C81EDC8|nr:gamma-glutamylcyclotransferase [Albidovulum sp.]
MAPALHPAFFGYGSLVNRATHDHGLGEPARLSGWRRVWHHTRLRDTPFLSVEPAEAEIDGLIAAVLGDDWQKLDLRETGYCRHPVTAERLSAAPQWAGRIEIYAVEERHILPPTGQPILLSYLDTVVQGFLREFGAAGVEGFFVTTTGWSALLDDRDAPRYPRSQKTTAAERRMVDDQTHALGLSRTKA